MVGLLASQSFTLKTLDSNSAYIREALEYYLTMVLDTFAQGCFSLARYVQVIVSRTEL